jgi:hypothetical protein
MKILLCTMWSIEETLNNLIAGLSPILLKRHIWRFLGAQNTIYGGRFPENFA